MEWTGAHYADKPTVEVRTWIDAPRDRVWEPRLRRRADRRG